MAAENGQSKVGDKTGEEVVVPLTPIVRSKHRRAIYGAAAERKVPWVVWDRFACILDFLRVDFDECCVPADGCVVGRLCYWAVSWL